MARRRNYQRIRPGEEVIAKNLTLDNKKTEGVALDENGTPRRFVGWITGLNHYLRIINDSKNTTSEYEYARGVGAEYPDGTPISGRWDVVGKKKSLEGK